MSTTTPPASRRASRRLRGPALLLVLFLIAGFGAAHAQISYSFSAGTGSPTDMSGATQIVDSDEDDASSSVQSIGFDFEFGGSTYSEFSASSNGLVGFGSNPVTTDFSNFLFPCDPIIAAFWDDLSTADDGGVFYQLNGNSPNQVLTIEWRVRHLDDDASDYTNTFQVRLYEGSNKIEYWYGTTLSDVVTGTIGAAACSGDYISILPGPPAAAYTYLQREDLIFPASGTLYTLTPVPFVPPAISITSPSEYSDFCVGSTLDVNWNTSSVSDVKIELSEDDGATYTTLTASYSTSALPFQWLITAPSGGGRYRVRVSDVNDVNTFDIVEFFINAPGPLVTFLDPGFIFPADGGMVDVFLDGGLFGTGCSTSIELFDILTNGGDPNSDIVVNSSEVDPFGISLDLSLRAQRGTADTGRVYSIIFRVTDENFERFDTVRVPVLSSSRWLTLDPVPDGWELLPMIPNPLPRNTEGIIPFLIPDTCRPIIDIYTLRGKWRKTLYLDQATIDNGVALWDGTDYAGQRLTAGTYVIQLTACGVRMISVVTLSDKRLPAGFDFIGGGEGGGEEGGGNGEGPPR